MFVEPNLSIIGAGLADTSRVRILCELMDGRAFTNKELACAAGITAQTASVHLKILEGSGLTSSLRSGRNVYHRIASEDVAILLESLSTLFPPDSPKRAKIHSLPDIETRRARSCYNHIAGHLGVLLFERLLAMDVLRLSGGVVEFGVSGESFCARMGFDLARFASAGKPLVRLCLDWTERKHHLSGVLGNLLMERALELGWLERVSIGRSLDVSALGYEVFARDFGLDRGLIDRGLFI